MPDPPRRGHYNITLVGDAMVFCMAWGPLSGGISGGGDAVVLFGGGGDRGGAVDWHRQNDSVNTVLVH